jgi:hypothetical protein
LNADDLANMLQQIAQKLVNYAIHFKQIIATSDINKSESYLQKLGRKETSLHRL